jgi:hypothetical protein
VTGRNLALRAGVLQAGVGATLAAPVAAGLAGHGAAMLALLWAGFAAAKLMAEPWLLTGAGARPSALATLLAGQAAVVAALWALGLGLSALTGWRPALPLWLPLALVLGAAVLGRAVWTPRPPDPRLDALLDEAVARLAAAPVAPLARDDRDRVEQVLAELETLPPDTPFDRLVSSLGWIGWGAAGRAMEQALLDRLAAGAAPRPAAAMLALAASDGLRIEDAGRDLPARAFVLLPDDPEILETFARRCAEELASTPEIWGALPAPALLEDRAALLPGTPAAAELARLAAACRAHPEAQP